MHSGRNLKGLLWRVKRLSQDVRLAACNDNHSQITVLHLKASEPEPAWPEGVLLSEKSIGAAAKRCGLGEKTLRRWMTEDPGFQAELAAARNAMFQAGMGRIQALTVRAVETLEDLLGAKKHPGVRLGAARTVVELGVHQHDAETIIRKLEEIEAQQRKQQQRR